MEKYRTFFPRFWAGWLDAVVLLPVALLDMYLSAQERGTIVLVVWAVVSYSTGWLYSVVLHARYGQTLGKMVMRVKVLHVSEDRTPTLRQAFMRDIGYIVPAIVSLGYLLYHLVFRRGHGEGAEMMTLLDEILGWAGLGWLVLEIISMLTNDKRRALHDYIAGTVVVRTS